MQNIGVAFIKTGQYVDASSSFEHIMSMSPNLKAGFNLILCYFAMGNSEQMKKAFQNLIAVPLEVDYDDKYISPNVSWKTPKHLPMFKQNKLCLYIVNEEKGEKYWMLGLYRICKLMCIYILNNLIRNFITIRIIKYLN